MPKVYVVQDPGSHNILPAEKYGEFIILLQKSDLKRGTTHCIQVLQDKLQGITDRDFLLPIGDPIMIGIATYLAVHYGEGRVNILRWFRETYRYDVEQITL